jgi:hypothetical protein
LLTTNSQADILTSHCVTLENRAFPSVEYIVRMAYTSSTTSPDIYGWVRSPTKVGLLLFKPIQLVFELLRHPK